MLLDVNLPRLSGFEVLKRLRASGFKAPVLMLTVRSSEEDQVKGLDLGADDYLTKPFSPRTLLARVRALLRRAGVERPAPLTSGDVVLDTENQTISVLGGAPVRLTALEFRLVQLMVANAGHTMPMERLTTPVWGYRGMGDRQLLKQLVHRVRRKIETDPASPRYLVTVSGVGLHRVRQGLLAGTHGTTTVTAEATNWGFWHFGEFSRAYKDCFGELPSDTLRRVPNGSR